jgi:hypothetical protein
MSRARENGNSKRDMVNYRVEILRQFLVVYNRKTARIARERLYEAQSEAEMDRIKMSMIDAGNVLSA